MFKQVSVVLLFIFSFFIRLDATYPSAPAPAPCSCTDLQPKDFINMKQYLAYLVIQRFKNTITADPLNITATWVGNLPCTYKGFYCDTPPNSPGTVTVASIDFNGFHLAAPSLEGFINGFPDLALFHANSNNFSGTVPNLLGLQYFFELDLSNNNLSGPFPVNVIPLTGLTFLDIRFNHFLGNVPSPIFSIGYEALFLNNNFFDGQIPDEAGSAPVEYLTFANNRFTGHIPCSLCKDADKLIEVLFLNNRLSGCLPYEIGYLKSLTIFDVGTNHLTGPIPLSFGCLSNVEQLNLAQNYLYGRVPEVLCQLAKTGNLVNISLSDNFFTSLGVNCWDLIKTNVLDVRGNCILGLPNQRSLKECSWFFSFPKICPLVGYMPCEAHPGGENKTCGTSDWPWNYNHPSSSLPHYMASKQLRGGNGN